MWRAKNQVEPEDSVGLPIYSSGCSNEPRIGQLIKAEHSDQDQEEEKFSLADLVGQFQSSASTPSLHIEKHKEPLNRNTDLSQETKKKKVTCTGEKHYSCPQCNKSFSSDGNVIRHKQTHAAEKPYSCDQCNKSFSESGKLVVHKRTYTGEKPNSIDQCNKSFSQSSNLDVHKRIHTGEKPFNCDQCNKSFSRSGHLVVH